MTSPFDSLFPVWPCIDCLGHWHHISFHAARGLTESGLYCVFELSWDAKCGAKDKESCKLKPYPNHSLSGNSQTKNCALSIQSFTTGLNNQRQKVTQSAIGQPNTQHWSFRKGRYCNHKTTDICSCMENGFFCVLSAWELLRTLFSHPKYFSVTKMDGRGYCGSRKWS